MGFVNDMKIELRILDERLLEFGGLSYAHPGDCGADLRAVGYFDSNGAPAWSLQAVIQPDEVLRVMTGISIHLGSAPEVFRQTPHALAALVLPRSGLASHHGVRPANTPGLIDMGYQGEIIVALRNEGRKPYWIQPLERIAQLMVVPCFTPTWTPVEYFTKGTQRGANGLGSSGKA